MMSDMLRRFDAFCFDLDGTIYVGDELLPYVTETIERLREHNKKILFLSNTSIQTREQCRERLEKMGISSVTEEIITSPYVSGMFFSEHFPNSRVLVIGEKVIEEELKHFSIQLTDDPAETSHVIVGLDRLFTYEKLILAMNAVRRGAHLVATNPDPVCPVTDGYIPDTLALIHAIETSSGKKVSYITGKPSKYYGQKVLDILQMDGQRCLMIGDRLETDIQLGKNTGLQTALVLTGVSNKEDIQTTGIKPDYVFKTLGDLFSNI